MTLLAISLIGTLMNQSPDTSLPTPSSTKPAEVQVISDWKGLGGVVSRKPV